MMRWRATAPDGYTPLFGYIATHGINPKQKLKYDPVADFEPIGLVVHSAVPAKNVQELVQLIKTRPGSFKTVAVLGCFRE